MNIISSQLNLINQREASNLTELYTERTIYHVDAKFVQKKKFTFHTGLFLKGSYSKSPKRSAKRSP